MQQHSQPFLLDSVEACPRLKQNKKKLFLPFFHQPNVTFYQLSNDYRLALPTKIFCWGGEVSAK